MSAIKEAFNLYKELKKKEAMEKRIIKKNFDYAYLKAIVEEVANTNVEIRIKTNDGADITVKKGIDYKNNRPNI